METDGSDCPEGGNSTDCLLRTLLHLLRGQRRADDAETNWDPITFWFTLVIGVAAALIAVVTALQAILAASRGRRKANERAIGRWSIHTETHRNWRDMSVQSTTWTPVLRENTLVKWHKSPTEGNSLPRGDGQPGITIIATCLRMLRIVGSKLASLREKLATVHVLRELVTPLGKLATPFRKLAIPLRKFFRRSRRVQPSAATWLGFFTQLGLTEVNSQEDKSGLRQTIADYLPDDLIAAPAYAEFGVILASAAAVGARFQYIEGEKRYPIILGRNFQFEFRQHPIIGTFGAYSEDLGPDLRPKAPGPEELNIALKHARGTFEALYLPKEEFNLLTGYNRQKMLSHLQHSHPFLSQTETPPALWPIGHLRGYGAIVKLCDIKRLEDYIPILSLLFFRTPRAIPALFPTPVLGTSLPLTAIALNGRYWKSLNFGPFKASTLVMWQLPAMKQPRWPHWSWRYRGAFDTEDNNYKFDGHDHYLDNENQEFSNYFLQRKKTAAESVSKAKKVVDEKEAKVDGARLAIANAGGTNKEELESQLAEAEKEATEAREALVLVQPELDYAKVALRQDEEDPRGHSLVLQMCIKFLDNPEGFLDWFANTPSENMRLRHPTKQTKKRLVRTHLIDVNRETEIKPARTRLANVICKYWTLVEARVEEYRDASPISAAVDVVALKRTLRAYRLLKAVAEIVRDHSRTHWSSEITDRASVDQAEQGKSSKPQAPTVLGPTETNEKWHTDEKIAATDEVIIYRWLMVALIFRTAPDSSEMIKSGLWEQIVPVI
ncbi:hypothetical protein CMUS01_14325 [Colletotrichum musicola]|uniref:Uncharacterized protein n=1 Tax=Colletotrichum musicola TaxID=2175873 RepID=A0A8H6MRL3_9PEZI|nr:hypothetical protein CMUS01_14325 [Colletotrichum musicola]